MQYAIMKGAKFVAKSGRKSSYTTNPLYAQVYRTREEAERNRCGNECIVTFPFIMLQGN